jgi:hypothetical protein
MAALTTRSKASAGRTGLADCGRTFSLIRDCFLCLPLRALYSSYCPAIITYVFWVTKVRRSTVLIFFYQYIANKILLINEFGTYKAPESISGAERDAQDDEIFQRARLVNCGYFMQIILRGISLQQAIKMIVSDICCRLRRCNSWFNA